MFHLFPGLEVKFRNKRAGKWQQKNQTKVFKKARRRNLHCYNVNRDENPQGENEIDMLTYGNENQTQPTLVYCVKFRDQKQNRTKKKQE